MFVWSGALFLILGTLAQAQPASPQAAVPAKVQMPTPKIALQKERSVARDSLVLDYNSWFENLTINGGQNPYSTKALLYGLGISYEYNFLHKKWGWGLGGGLVHGFAVSGDASDNTSYYVKRVPLELFRGTGRYFWRISPRFDAGFLGTVLYTLTTWPNSNGLSVEKPSSLMLGFFADTRWRIDRRWELLQAVGTFNRGPSLAWRIGANYSF